ncbi:LysM peptidoglycan-binding domain-containing protein [Phosphitispora sp. TUW77]|uniref:LysM peptidoglycan-binding domain-containing protein n=1 Tax=Phosphitispora sp. TUW77 TaxID=3152361 RepID=UPI003AB60282
MSTIKVLLSNSIIPKLTSIFEASPKCEWGGVLVGDIIEEADIITTTIYEVIPAAYKESFLNEFRTASQMWKGFYAERDRLYSGAKIVGWYYYSPTSQQPSKPNIDIHKTFFDTPNSVFLFLDHNGTPHCFKKDASGNSFLPVIYSEFTKQDSLTINKGAFTGESVTETGVNRWLKTGLKKVGLFIIFFAICILGIMYNDLTKPIVKTSGLTSVSTPENAIPENSAPENAAKETLVPDSPPSAAIQGSQPDNKSTEVVQEVVQTESSGINVAENTSQPEQNYYIVKKGDSLWVISEKFYGTGFKFYKIMETNNIYNPRNLYTGQKLIIVPDSNE